MNRLTQTDTDPVGEATLYSVRIADVRVPDGAGGLRFATALEADDLELTVTDIGTAGVINALDAVPLLPDHGSYTEATGVLLVDLVAVDNPIVSATLGAGKSERHKILVHMPGLLWAEIIFSVQNQERIPTPP